VRTIFEETLIMDIENQAEFTKSLTDSYHLKAIFWLLIVGSLLVNYLIATLLTLLGVTHLFARALCSIPITYSLFFASVGVWVRYILLHELTLQKLNLSFQSAPGGPIARKERFPTGARPPANVDAIVAPFILATYIGWSLAKGHLILIESVFHEYCRKRVPEGKNHFESWKMVVLKRTFGVFCIVWLMTVVFLLGAEVRCPNQTGLADIVFSCLTAPNTMP